MNMLGSIRNRLMIMLLTIIISVSVISLIKSYQDARYEVQELFDAQLAQSARTLQAQILHKLNTIDPQAFQEILDNEARLARLQEQSSTPQGGPISPFGHEYERKIAFQIWDQHGQLMIHSVASPALPLSPDHLAKRQPGYSDEIIEDRNWRVFTLLESNNLHVIQVGELYEVRDELTHKISRRLIKPSLISLPILALMIWIGIGRGLAPLLKVTREISLRAPDYLEPIVMDPVPSEIHPLALALNSLLARLKDALEKERRLTDDAAHELRTPLAALKVQAQVAIKSRDAEEHKKALQQIVNGVDRISHLIEQMLTLARFDPRNRDFPLSQINLRKATEEVLAQYVPKALNRGIEFIVNDGDLIRIQAEHSVLSILLGNLIDNAIKFSPPGGKIQVNITDNSDHALWSIRDEGPGIDSSEEKRIFDRFYRIAGTDTNGSGLGLAIVQQCVDLLQADISINNASESDGLIVELRFKR